MSIIFPEKKQSQRNGRVVVTRVKDRTHNTCSGCSLCFSDTGAGLKTGAYMSAADR